MRNAILNSYGTADVRWGVPEGAILVASLPADAVALSLAGVVFGEALVGFRHEGTNAMPEFHGFVIEADWAERLGSAASAWVELGLRCKVSAKGAISVYGLQRWPVTLYADQWEKLSRLMPDIERFINANAPILSRK